MAKTYAPPYRDYKAEERHYLRTVFRSLRSTHIFDCCDEWRDACWDWLNCSLVEAKPVGAEKQ